MKTQITIILLALVLLSGCGEPESKYVCQPYDSYLGVSVECWEREFPDKIAQIDYNKYGTFSTETVCDLCVYSLD